MIPIPTDEIFARSSALYGSDGLERLKKSVVAVAGLGGVGSYAAEALARAGVGALRIIDCDVVKATDINRQLFALWTNVGTPKVEAARERLLAINPALSVDHRYAFFHEDTAETLITQEIDFVIDAIDSLNPKTELIRRCVDKMVALISAMGAAGRMDTGKISLSLLKDTRNCPLARALRIRLRRRGITMDIPVVYSSEIPRKTDTAAGKETLETSGTYLRGRPRQSLPSISTIPAIFGLMAAHYAIVYLLQGKDQQKAQVGG